MTLIHLPFQTKQHTHLASTPIKGKIAVQDLPVAYHNLINLSSNGGYTMASYLPTKHKTLDATDHLYVPYIAGLYDHTPTEPYLVPNLLAQTDFYFHQDVGEDEVIFYEDHDRVLTFDYTGLAGSNQPRIIYHEFSTDVHFAVAATFQHFLDQLCNHPDVLPHHSLDSYHRANAAFLHVESPRELSRLLTHYADPALAADHKWYQAWIHYFSHHEQTLYQHIATNSLD
ncbi:MAG: hypothetical protein Q4A55_01340 [Aerococcus sp.]|nr:hypothetical protein [Aerococcus sp.]